MGDPTPSLDMTNVPVNRLSELLDYCSSTGRLTWKTRRCGVKVGTEAGTPHKGYRRIKVDGRLLLSHRVAWAIHHGRWPTGEIDHVNRIRGDNRIDNLRESSRSGNMINRTYPVGASGVTGVSKHKCGWTAFIRINGKSRHLGLFSTVPEAAAARRAAERLIYQNLIPMERQNDD